MYDPTGIDPLDIAMRTALENDKAVAPQPVGDLTGQDIVIISCILMACMLMVIGVIGFIWTM